MTTTIPSIKVSSRIASIDIVRGLIMVIMALDHVREYFGSTPFRAEDVTQTSVALFGTRWITHLCAPNFVFLSGISIFLYLQKKGSVRDTAIFLLTRGLWLVLVEVVLITFVLQLSYDIILFEVIWVIGWSMILFAGLIWLPRKVIAVLAFIILAGHNLVPQGATSDVAGVFAGLFLHSPFVIMNSSGVPVVLVAYTILPWLGVMMAGYCVGAWVLLPADKAFANFWKAGTAMLALFVVLRLINVYGDPSPWSVQPRGWVYTFLSFINVSKYPPSLLFDLLTVGIGMLLLAAFTKLRGRVTEWLRVFGQVPFFYFIVHLSFISLAALIWTSISFGRYVNLGFTNPADWPREYEPSLLRVIAVWICVVLVLYFPCRWFANYRKGHQSRWLSYL
ncbi:MAG TPA: heparan-alpha-glucosaminide N-acetyltransferase domain-containing protein [Chryseolinea sp.]|nr:heparan-alpha-glucosaminide N-acetyltransferase domain-containing protein [Chryseolinea sp.]